MTLFEFAVTYAVCWWLVLFMVLPHQADAPATPERGHAASAPVNPQLKKKLRWATIFAILPAVAMYFIVGSAQAEDAIYHTGSTHPDDTIYHAGHHGCEGIDAKPRDDVAARDGYGTGDKQVKPANLEGSNILSDKDHYDIPINIPSAGYLDHPNGAANPAVNPRNADLSQSFIGVGKVSIGKDGSATMDGKPLAGTTPPPAGCDHPID